MTGGVTWLVDLGTKKVSYAKPPLTEFEFDIFTQSKTHLTSKEGFRISVSQSVGGGRVGYTPFRQLSFLWCIFGVLENNLQHNLLNARDVGWGVKAYLEVYQKTSFLVAGGDCKLLL